jgi:hypothetical protein
MHVGCSVHMHARFPMSIASMSMKYIYNCLDEIC